MAREAYVRVTYRIRGREVTVGVELRPDDDLVPLRAAIKTRLALQATLLTHDITDDLLAESVEGVLWLRFPDRAYFIEVGDPDDAWVQVYDPRNFVKERCPCGERCTAR